MRLGPPQVPLPFLTLQVLLCLDPSPPWDLFSALSLALLCYLIISPSVLQIDTGVGLMNISYGANIALCAVNGFYLLLLAKPLRNFKYIGNGKASTSMQNDKVWWRKYFDVVCIIYSPRLIGWSHQVRALHYRYIPDC